jgi:flagellar biosynthesis/type III secretory pathway chaperone
MKKKTAKKKKKLEAPDLKKIAKERRARGMTQVVQYLKSKCKALRSINLHN